LIRSTNWIGDVVMTTPAIRAIRQHFPESQIFMLAKPWVIPVLENNPHLDQIIAYQTAGRHRGSHGKIRLVKDLRKYNFEAVILFQNAFEAALITFLARIPIRIGYNTDARGFFLTHSINCEPEIKKKHQTQYYLGILRGIGLDTCGTQLELMMGEKERSAAEVILSQYGVSGEDLIIGINPGATYGAAKRWYPERYAELCVRMYRKFGARILIFGGQKEKDLGSRIHLATGNYCINLCGKTTLGEAMALIDRCGLFVTNDSGLMHVGAALDIPLVAIFGSTNPATTGPAGSRGRIIRVPAPCSPCLKVDCPADHRCMKEITVDMVFAEAEKIIRTG
jgi:heptosyltransferase-2